MLTMSCIIREPNGTVYTDTLLCEQYLSMPESHFDESTIFVEEGDAIGVVIKPSGYIPIRDGPPTQFVRARYRRYDPETYSKLGLLPTWETLALAPLELLQFWYKCTDRISRDKFLTNFIFQHNNMDTIEWWWRIVCKHGDPKKVHGFNLNTISARGHVAVLDWIWDLHDDHDIPRMVIPDCDDFCDKPVIYYNYKSIKYARQYGHDAVLQWWMSADAQMFGHPALL